MTRQLDVDRLLDSWLAEGPNELPDHAVDNILNQLDENEQRRRWLPGRERMNRMIFAIGGIAAVVAVAFLGYRFYGNQPGVGGPPGPTPIPTATPIALPTGDAAIQPGRYSVDLHGYRYTVTIVSDGDVADTFAGSGTFVNSGQWGVNWDGEGTVPNFAGMVIYGAVSSLYGEPCQWPGSEFTPGPTVDDLATALANLDGFTSTEPVEVTLAGYQGKRLQLTVPNGVNSETCPNAEYRSFAGKGDGYASAGQTDDIRIMDLNGTRHLIVLHYQRGTPVEAQAWLEQMLDSLDIDPVVP